MIKIALTSSSGDNMHFIRPRYVNALMRFAREAGIDVLPVILPITTDDALLEAYANEFDGFICTGGDDIDPSIYGEEKHPKCGAIESTRDICELALLNKVTALDKPVFGICRGIQVMNVALGGTLWQDIPSQWSEPHGTVHFERNENNDPRHRVTVSGMLREVLGEDVVVTNSYHHQAVKKPGDGLVICGVNEDGIVEAVEHTELTFYRAVQWHPELDPDDVSKKLFTEFLRHVQA
jgi:putative glutamine amidotransferase